MKRLWLYIASLVLLLALLLAGGIYWLLGTTAGARFALARLTGVAGLTVSAQRVEGRLWDHLHLTGVRAARAKQRAEIDSLDLVWHPRQLFDRHLEVDQLILSGVRVQDDTPPTGKPPSLRWPRISPLLWRYSVHISRFRISGLQYRHLQGTPVVVNEFSTPASFQYGILTLPGLRLLSPQGSAVGEMALGFWRPLLTADLSVIPAKPVQKMDLLSLQARLLPARGEEQMAGPVALAGRSGGRQRLEVSGELGMTASAFNIHRLTLFRPGTRGVLTGKGTITPTAGEPLFDLALKASDLDLAEQLKRSTRLSGTVNVAGSASRYHGNFALTNKGPGWERASLASKFRGTKEGAELSQIAGQLLGGRVGGALKFGWTRGVKVNGTLSGRGLDPARLAAKWKGIVNLDLAGDFEVPKQGAMRGALRGKLMESRLHGQSLNGEFDASFVAKSVTIARLLLVGKGFDLRASGQVDRRLAFTADVTDLSSLLPNAAGQLQVAGWARYRDSVLSGSLRGKGARLAAAGVRAAALQLQATLGEGAGYPVDVTAAASGLAVGRLKMDSALLSLKGTATQHILDAQLHSAPLDGHATLAGGYRDGVWSGQLTRLTGHDQVGPFALAAPARLTLSKGDVATSPLLINGVPGERVELAVDIRRHPSSGTVRASWTAVNLARANAWLQGTTLAGGSSGAVDLRLLPGDRLVVNGRADARGEVAADGRKVALQWLWAKVEGDARGIRVTSDILLQGGEGEAHLLFTSAEPATLSLPRQGELEMNLVNVDLALLRPVAPSNLVVDGRLAGVVRGRLAPGGMIDLRGNAALNGGHLHYTREGEVADASIQTAELAFNWRGRRDKPKAGILQVNARAAATGTYTAKGQQVGLSRLTLRVDADQQGTRASMEASLDKGGGLRGALTSSSPAGPAIPETGDFAMEWGGIDPSLMKPFLPAGLNLQGNFAGEAKGRLLPGKRLEMAGEAVFSQGRAQWQGESGEVNASLRSATLAFGWRGETLTGTLDLALADYGRARGNFELPIPARLPVAPLANGAVRGGLAGRVQERGFLSGFLPGVIQQSHGQLDIDLGVTGVWSNPRLTGTVQFANAGAYLPAAGITLTDVQFLARLEVDQIRIDNLTATSGTGKLQGTMLVQLSGWTVTGYSGTLSGERFQTVYLPELQMVTSPKLTFQGKGHDLTVRGEVRVPQLLVLGPPVRPIVTPSGDVILEGAPPASPGKKFPLAVDGRVHVVLGDKVQVKASGIDAKLAGEMDLVLKGLDTITSRGEIRVVKGSYKAYGLELEIVRGRLYYEDDPVNQPTLDILALRTIGDVKAGVTVGGYLRAPVIKLYSEPSMPEVDILAYMVLGHPLGTTTGTDQAGMLATAASGLFSFGQSESIQEQIKDRLGLSVLGMETVTPSSAGLMGYKEVPVTTPTGAPSKAAASQSLLTVGKYLTPKLYVSYGRSLVTGGSLFMLRYDLFKHWQVETQSGTESGADLYYKIEFD